MTLKRKDKITQTSYRRFHRLRSSNVLRDTLADVRLHRENFILPLFLRKGTGLRTEIPLMPGVYQQTSDIAIAQISELADKGLGSIILFGILESKDTNGSGAYDPQGPVPEGIRAIKEVFGDAIQIYADVCLCEYTSHGHCGILTKEGKIDNDASLPPLAETARVYAEAGADWVAPSNMMDGRVSSIRELLDEEGYKHIPILSYSAKFSSNYYGPFREAAESAPSHGDRKSYQIDFRSWRTPLREMREDELQGADALMVKPALAYLDILARAKQQTDLPLYAYNVSGEYSMVKFGAAQGLFDEHKLVLENLTSIKRAGADMILSYHTADVLAEDWI